MKTKIQFDPHKALESGRNTLLCEADALQDLSARLDQSFSDAVSLMLHCRGRIILTGLGKTGHIARKISATLSSTGSPAMFVHAAEALHGDLGAVTSDDLVIAVSYSGSSQEFATMLPVVKRLGVPIIAISGGPESELAQTADIFLDSFVVREACPLNLAPTASTTAALAIGDALAVACLQARGFSAGDFARSHPGGALGRRLLTYVEDIMRTGDDIPSVPQDATLDQTLAEISHKSMGMTAIVDDHGHPVGIFTDGDLRRLIKSGQDLHNIQLLPIQSIMTGAPKCIDRHALAVDAANAMEKSKISNILVTEQDRLVGALHMHDLMMAKVI